MKFKKINIGTESNPTYEYGVDLDSITNENEFGIYGLGWYGWTSNEVQIIIHNSHKLKINEEYDYQVEGSDFYILVKKEHVNMWARESRTPDISWTFEKFISFMEDFKSFLKQNNK